MKSGENLWQTNAWHTNEESQQCMAHIYKIHKPEELGRFKF